MYDQFSRIYDELVFDIDYERYSRHILTALEEEDYLGGSLLELGCGTGRLTEKLAGRATSVFAVDLSDRMLSLAWERLEGRDNVTFSCQDMTRLRAPQSDACISLLDTFNYVDGAGLEKTLDRLSVVLKPGAALAFDLNSSFRLLEEIGDRTWIYEKDDIFYSWESRREENRVESWLTFFLKQDSGFYDRIDEHQVQYYHDPEMVVDLLAARGFEHIRIRDLDRMDTPHDRSRRILISARKR